MKRNDLKKTMCIGLAGIMFAVSATGCAKEEKPAVEEETVSIANPWTDITADEARTLCTRLFKAPDGASDIKWSKMEEAGADPLTKGPLVQLDFTLDGMDFCARAQYGADENADISGMYFNWDAEDEVTLANWGMGNMKGKTYRAITDDGYADLITWYDIEIGIAYSLSVTAPDLDGFDIQAIAESMYDPANEPTNDIPD